MLNCSTVKVNGVNEIAIVHSNNTYSAITSRHPSWTRAPTDTTVYPGHFPPELLSPSLSDWVKNDEDVVELLKYIQQIPNKFRNKTVRGVGTNSEYYICANNEKGFTILTIQRTPNFYK